MRKKFFLLLLSLSNIFLAKLSAQPAYELIHEYLSSGQFENKYNKLVWNITNEILSSTKFKNKVKINEAPDSNYVNIFIYKNDPKRYFQECNCSFLGQGNLIVCDEKFFDQFSSLLSVNPESQVPFLSDSGSSTSDIGASTSFYLNLNTRYFLIGWILAHEIGHLILEHPVASFYKDNGLKQFFYQEFTFDRESTADSFAVNQIGYLKGYEVAYVYHGINNMIAKLYPDAFRSWFTKDYSKIYLANNRDKHPPWLYRLIKMQKLIIDKYEEVFDKSGYYEFLESKIKLSDTTTSKIEALCNSESEHKNLDSFYVSSMNSDSLNLPTFLSRCNILYLNKKQYLLDVYLSKLYQTTPKSHYKYNEFIANLYFYKGLLEYDKANFSKALLYWDSVNVELLLNELPYQENEYAMNGFEEIVDKAIKSFNNQLHINYLNNQGRILQRIGVAQLVNGNIIGAIESFSKQLQVTPILAESWLSLYIAQIIKGDTANALFYFNIAMILDSSFREHNVLEYISGWPSTLLPEFLKNSNRTLDKKTLTEEKTRNTLYLIAAEFYYHNKFNEAVRIMYLLTSNQDPINQSLTLRAEHKNFEGMCRRAIEDYSGALACYKDALNLRNQEFINNPSNLNRFYSGQTLFNIGNLFLEQEDTTTACMYYLDCIDKINKCDLSKVDATIWNEFLKFFRKISTTLFFAKRYQDGLQSILCLDSLAMKLPHESEENLAFYLTSINNVFYYFKRLRQENNILHNSAMEYLVNKKETIEKNHNIQEQSKKEILESINYLKSYFTDMVLMHYINGIDFKSQENEKFNSNRVMLLKAFYQFDSSLILCTDKRFPSILQSLIETKETIYKDLPHTNDTAITINLILKKHLLTCKSMFSEEVDSSVLAKNLNKVVNELSFEYLLKGNFELAKENTLEALQYDPKNLSNKIIKFLISSKRDQKRMVDEFSNILKKETLEFIYELPENIKSRVEIKNAQKILQKKVK